MNIVGILDRVFKRQKDDKIEALEVIESNIDVNEELNSQSEYVELSLSVHPSEAARMPEIEKRQLERELKECPPIKKNDVNIAGIYAFKTDKGLEVSFFIRNGLEKSIKLDMIPLSVVNQNGDILAYQRFDLATMGEVEKFSARPWKVDFRAENVFVDEVPRDSWKVIFETRKIN